MDNVVRDKKFFKLGGNKLSTSSSIAPSVDAIAELQINQLVVFYEVFEVAKFFLQSGSASLFFLQLGDHVKFTP